MKRHFRLLAATIAATIAAASALAMSPGTAATSSAGTGTSSPHVAGPLADGGANGRPWMGNAAALLAQFGYTEREYLLSGTAPSFVPVAPVATDGRGTVRPDASPPS